MPLLNENIERKQEKTDGIIYDIPLSPDFTHSISPM